MGQHEDTWKSQRDLDESFIATYFARIRKRKSHIYSARKRTTSRRAGNLTSAQGRALN